MKIGLSDPAFGSYFREFYPEIEVIKKSSEVDNYDLIVAPGGEDISPYIYGQNNKYSHYNEHRDEKEVPIVKAALNHGIHILGVCRGHQLINVLLGGKIYQDILFDARVSHESRHDLDFIEIGQEDLVKKHFESGVNSLHHQGIFKEGRGLQISSLYKGIIESCINERILTVQFHPEFMDNSRGFFNDILDWANNKTDYYNHPDLRSKGESSKYFIPEPPQVEEQIRGLENNLIYNPFSPTIPEGARNRWRISHGLPTSENNNEENNNFGYVWRDDHWHRLENMEELRFGEIIVGAEEIMEQEGIDPRDNNEEDL